MIDNELTIKVINKKVWYNVKFDKLTDYKQEINRNCKEGYLAYDIYGTNIGIVFMSDDKRTQRYGSAEILFYKKFANQYGVWRNIKINRQYLSYEKLVQTLTKQGEFTLTTGARYRKD